MALNIKNPEVERLAAEVAQLTGTTKTEAIRQALLRHRETFETATGKGRRLRHYLETVIWPSIPPGERGRTLTKEEEEEILGFGPDGV